MPKVEQETKTSEILRYENELPKNVRFEIAQIAERKGYQFISWEGLNSGGKNVELSMYFSGSIYSPVRFGFKQGAEIIIYEETWLNPFHRFNYDLKAPDVADFFVIAHKALVDGITPRNMAAAFENTFLVEHFREESAQQLKERLSCELTARKYLS